jgi:hypothetical protein
LRLLNVAGVGMTLAAATSLVFGYLLHDPYFGPSTLVTGLPTLVIGTCWAALLRWRKEVKLGRWKPRLGWLLSVPLAALNGALAGGILIASDPPSPNEWFFKFLGGAFMGSTFGIIVWLPALMATLLLFGLPIARAQKAALQGFSGEERGERTLGLTNVVISALVLAGVALAPAGEASGPYSIPGLIVLCALILGGLLTGSLTGLFAHRREQARHRFVEAVEQGKVPGFRVEPAGTGKMLLRVSSEGEGYRAAEFDEELFALDEEGNVQQAIPPRLLADPPIEQR